MKQMGSIALALLVILLIALPGAAIAQTTEYVPEWETDDISGNISAIISNDYGTIWYIGTDTGNLYKYNQYGVKVWETPKQFDTSTITSLLLTEDLIGIQYASGKVYLVSTTTGEVWKEYTSTVSKYAITQNGKEFFIQNYDPTNTNTAIGIHVYENRTIDFCVIPALIPESISFSSTAVIGGKSSSTSTVVSIPYSNLVNASIAPDISGFALPSDLYTGFSKYKIITFSAPENDTILKQVRVYNTTGTDSFNADYWEIHAPGTRADYGDIRFYQSQQCTYYSFPLTNENNSRDMWVEIDTSCPYIIIGYGASGVTPAYNTSGYAYNLNSLDYFNTFTKGTGSVSMSGGVMTLDGTTGWWGAAGYTKLQVDKTLPFTLEYDYRKVNSYDSQGTNSAVALSIYICDSANVTREPTYYGEPTGNAQAKVFNNTILSSTYQHATLKYYGNGSYSINSETAKTISTWSTLPNKFNIEFFNRDYGGSHPGNYANIKLYSVPASTMNITLEDEIELSIPTTYTKGVTGTVTKTITRGSTSVIETSSNLYIQTLTSTGTFGTTVTCSGITGTPMGLDVTKDCNGIIEGRSSTVNIFKLDGTRTGTYDAGANIIDVHIAYENGLYALATSGDRKFYLFSKDESSIWYLLYASPAGSNINCGYMTTYGDYFAIARGSTLSVYLSTQAEALTGMATLKVFQDGKPVSNTELIVQQYVNGEWSQSEVYITDSYGTAVIDIEYGKRFKVIIGEYETVLIPSPTQPEYVITVPGEEPLRTGANYKSWYDSSTRRIYYSYQDTRGKTHMATFEIIRNSDGKTVWTHYITIPDGDTSVHTGYYQIPPGYTNTSYRVKLTAEGSPSFSNTWQQWIFSDSGITELPSEVSDEMALWIFLILLLFIGGIFSYFSGPFGAVVVSIFAGALVIWGWLPMSPSIVILCIIWSFLGVLGRTGSE